MTYLWIQKGMDLSVYRLGTYSGPTVPHAQNHSLTTLPRHGFEIDLSMYPSLGRYTDIDGGLTHRMKILLDEMCDGWHDRLQLCEHDVYSVVRLRRQDCNLPNDHAVIAYARDNGMVLVTKDNRCGRDCEAAGVPCILLDDEEMFRVLLAKIEGLEKHADKMGASDAYT